jgi:hypothetical protein
MQAKSSTEGTEITCKIICVKTFHMIGTFLDAAFLVGLARATLRTKGPFGTSKSLTKKGAVTYHKSRIVVC